MKQDNFQLIISKEFPALIMLTGDELYLLNKFQQQIINAWHKIGESDKQKHELQSKECWHNLFQATKIASIFQSRQLFIAHNTKTSLDQNTQEIIKNYLQSPLNSNNLILVIAPQMTSKSLQFLSKLPNNSVVNIKAPAASAVKQWIRQQLSKKYNYNEAIVELIYNQTEGNLLATAQSLTKIMLCHPTPCELTPAIITPHLNTDCIFSVFEFTNQILVGNFDKAIFILKTILQDYNEFHLMLWQFAQILRQIYKIQFYVKYNNADINTAINQAGVWSSQINYYKKFAGNLSLSTIHKLIMLCHKIDYNSKTGNYEQAVRQLELGIKQLTNSHVE